MFKKIAMASALLSASATTFGQEVTLEHVQSKFPGTNVISVSEVPSFPGIYEMVIDKNKIMYVNKNVDKLMIGHIFDLQTRQDETQQRINSLSRIDFNSLPFENAIKVVKGNGKRHFAVFTDPDCPYCKKLESVLDSITDYTMYLFPMPIPSLHPGAVSKSSAIWCSQKPYQAWQNYLLKGISPPPAPKNCTSPIANNMELGNRLGVRGTPAMIGPDGIIKPGVPPKNPAKAINSWLTEVNK